MLKQIVVRLSLLALPLLVTVNCTGPAAMPGSPGPATATTTPSPTVPAAETPAASPVTGRPADFAVEYHWAEGSLPPPYYYEYTIRLGPGTRGEIVFQPGYESDQPPTWTETFELREGDLDRLYDLMQARGLFTGNWSQEEAPPGSSGEELRVSAAGQETVIPYSGTGIDQTRAEIYQAIKELVPETTWAGLTARHEQYKEEQLSGAGQGQDELVTTDTVDGVIFSQASAELMNLAPLLDPKAEGYWTPSQADVLAMEEQLPAYLEQAAPAQGRGPLRELPMYKRQYVGILSQGHRVIFANFFCDTTPKENWQTEFVFVMDGGTCYFEVAYDVETGEFTRLSIHGEA